MMDTMHERCAGLDVHKRTVAACVRWVERGEAHQEIRTFGTMTGDLLAMSDWLGEHQVSVVAMESTGVYWKPIFNVLEGGFEVMLVNAQHIKQVPGRKTDVADCQWIAQLLQHGLLRASFVPDRPQRELRDLTRQRAQLVGEKTRTANRIQKVLEDANVKLASVATDALGASGRDMIRALIDGRNDAEAMAELARYRLRKKIPQLREALHGRVTDHHRFMLRMLMEQLEAVERQVAAFDERIEQTLGPTERRCVERLRTIDGIEARAAQNILAEIGADMGRFPSAAHLASWAGLCPGNHESAGKRRRGTTTHGNRWLRQTLVQCAWAAGRRKGRYLAAQHRRLARRRGGKRAAVAVAHSLLGIIYHVLRDDEDYRDLGGDYFDRIRPEQLTRSLVRRLEQLGHRVVLETPAA